MAKYQSTSLERKDGQCDDAINCCKKVVTALPVYVSANVKGAKVLTLFKKV